MANLTWKTANIQHTDPKCSVVRRKVRSESIENLLHLTDGPADTRNDMSSFPIGVKTNHKIHQLGVGTFVCPIKRSVLVNTITVFIDAAAYLQVGRLVIMNTSRDWDWRLLLQEQERLPGFVGRMRLDCLEYGQLTQASQTKTRKPEPAILGGRTVYFLPVEIYSVSV
jgi:hypothetical protein